MGQSDDYSLFFETSPQPLYIVSKRTMKFVAVNEAMVLKYGYSKEEFLKMSLLDIRPADDVEAFEKEFATSLAGLAKRSIWRHKLKDGSIRLMDITARTINWQGEDCRFVMADDVTEKLLAVEELAASEERLRTAIAVAPYPVMIHANGPEVISVSRSWIEGTGYEMEDLKDLHSWTDHAFEDQAESIRQGIAEVQSRSSLRHQQVYRLKCKDGSFCIWDIVTVPAGQLFDGRNMAISCGYDITERELLSSSLKLKSAALDAVSNEVFVTDLAGLEEWLNPCKAAADETLGSSDEPITLQSIPEDILKGEAWKGEIAYLRPDGSKYIEEASITPVKGPTGSFDHFIGIKRDVTQRRKSADLIDARLRIFETSRNLSVKETLTLALDEACRLTQSSIGFYHLIDPHQTSVTMQAWSSNTLELFGRPGPEQNQFPIPSESIWADCIKSQQPTVHNDFQDNFPPEILPPGHSVTNRKIIIPIVRNNLVVALVAVGNKPRNYLDEDVEVVKYFADIAWEVAERKAAEDLQMLQSAALEAADNAIIITDRRGAIEWANPAFSRLTGYSHEEVIGKTPKQLVHSDLQPEETYREMWQTIGSQRVWSGDLINRRKDGQLYIEEQTITPMVGRTGEIEHYIGIKEDVTHYRRSESLLEARLNFSERVRTEGAESILRAAVEHAGLLTFSPKGCFKILDKSPVAGSSILFEAGNGTYCSSSDPADLNSNSSDLYWADCLATSKAQIRNLTNERLKSVKNHLRFLTVPVLRDDEIVAMLSVQGGVADYTGADVETVSYLAEIAYETIRQYTREKDNLRQGALLEQLYDAVLAWKLDGRIVYWNKGAERLYGYSSQEALGQSVHKLLRTEFSRYSSEHATALAINDRWEGELTNISKSGKSLLVESRMTLTSDPDQQLVLEVNRDITATRAAEEQLLSLNSDLEERVLSRTAELSIAKAEADKANSAKSEFLSRMSHELRTPLNSILGFSQIIQLHHPDGEVKELSDPIIKAGTHLLELINEILDISRIEAGGLTIDVAPVPLMAPIQDALDLIAPLANAADMTMELPEGESDVWISVDSRRFVQVVLNVLSNAVKYNRPSGKIWLSWAIEDDLLLLRIRDQGTGISAANCPRLFEPFARFGDSFVEGTGLGLPLSKRLINLMNGDLYLENSSPTGSTFVITIPTAQRLAVSTTSPQPVTDYGLQELAAGKILYIEDDLGNIQLIDHLVALFPEVTLLPCMQGGMALELAQLHNPSLIILDAHLPDMTGQDVLKALKISEATKDIPVVVLTADATDQNRESLSAAGAYEFVTKPIDVECLMKLISVTLGGRIT